MDSKKTVVVGASTNTSRYSWLACQMLSESGHEIVPVGIKKGEVLGKGILDIRTKPQINEVDTITMYIGARHQPDYYSYLLGLKPKRIIFNPGTENAELEELAEAQGIDVLEACTLVLLRSNQF